MQNQIPDLQTVVLFRQEYFGRLQKYIVHNRPAHTKAERAEILADTVHRILDQQLTSFSDNQRAALRVSLLEEAVRARSFDICGNHVLSACRRLDSNSPGPWHQGFQQWLCDQGFESDIAAEIALQVFTEAQTALTKQNAVPADSPNVLQDNLPVISAYSRYAEKLTPLTTLLRRKRLTLTAAAAVLLMLVTGPASLTESALFPAASSRAAAESIGASSVSPVYYRDQALVLTYHQIAPVEDEATISPERFASHMNMLREKGYQPISMERLLGFLRGTGTLPPNAVVITFDDGYAGYYRYALPVLSDCGYPAALFLITGQMNQTSDHVKLDWSQITSAAPLPTTYYPHTSNSHHLVALNAAGDTGPALTNRAYLPEENRQETDVEYRTRILSDLLLSRQALQDHIGDSPACMALPYGASSPELQTLLQASGFQYVFTSQPGFASRTANPLALPRINAGSPSLTADSLFSLLQNP